MSGLSTYLPEKREFTRPQMPRLARKWRTAPACV